MQQVEKDAAFVVRVAGKGLAWGGAGRAEPWCSFQPRRQAPQLPQAPLRSPAPGSPKLA